jgi:hypothetical protein
MSHHLSVWLILLSLALWKIYLRLVL